MLPIVPSIPGFGKEPESMFQAMQAMAEILRGHGLAGARKTLTPRITAVEAEDLPKDGSEAMIGSLSLPSGFNSASWPRFHVAKNDFQAISAVTVTTVEWNEEVFDDGNDMEIVTPWKFTAPVDVGIGIYLFTAAIAYSAAVDQGAIQVRFARDDGVTDAALNFLASGTIQQDSGLTVIFKLGAGTKVWVNTFNTAACNIGLAGQRTFFMGCRIA